MRSLLLLVLLSSISFLFAQDDSPPPGVKDTKTHSKQPPKPEESLKLFKPMDGFNVTLFAGEPHVCQPISLAFDDRGRLWVAECYSYPRWVKNAPQGKDRILIFEDTDGDGKFDKRIVFQDNLDNLTSVAIGHGGVWALCAPNLLFFPVKDGEDRPAGKPQIMLDGWTLEANHNIVNGLTWGPDGWLYGCHGIIKESKPGVPGTPDAKRPRINCGIWRYHPTRHLVEAVCHGTTNPWGLDFDEHGEGYFTNCVIGHLWHMIPGAHYKRMYGLDYNKYAYELIDATSEHLHWAGGNWTESRTGKAHSDAGGGHAHSGCMVYLGDSFPAEFHNRVFMCNIHGHRLNVDRIERKGNSYVGKRAPDFLKSDDEWHRGVAVTYGPDGAVYVADWCDLGECHDHDGTHRSSGRIYRVQSAKAKPMKPFDLRKKNARELIELALHGNEWQSRRARLLLSERSSSLRDNLEIEAELRECLKEKKDIRVVLRAMWALSTTFGTLDRRAKIFSEEPLLADWVYIPLDHQDERVRACAVENIPWERKSFDKEWDKQLGDSSGLVRMHLAVELQGMSSKTRLRRAVKLVEHAEDANDRVQPLLIWYGIEPAVAEFPEEGLKLAAQSKMPKIRQFIARRIAEIGKPEPLNAVVLAVAKEKDGEVQRDLLQGLRDGLKGSRSVKMPAGWRDAYAQLSSSKSNEIRRIGALLALQFDDADALASLRKQMSDPTAASSERLLALQALVEKAVPDLTPSLIKLLDDRAVRGPALRALAAYADASIPKEILRVYPKLNDAEKQDAISTLSSRPAFALALLDAVEKKQVARADVTPFTARQLSDMKNDEVKARVDKVWGQIRKTSTEKQALIEKYKKMLTPDVLAKADLSAGRVVFNKTCAQCHMLYGEGHKIGPDLTGSDRGNLHYIIENSVDPSAVIGADYRLTNIITGRGRQIAGIIVEETDRAVTVQTATERIVVPKIEIEDRKVSDVSMMPEGQLEKMTREELRDLVGYLASKTQVPLPK